MEEIPMFKFKKAETKKVGDFDVMDTSEWTLIIKPQIQDVTLFVHFHKLWNVTEVAGVEADYDNHIEGVKEIKAYPAWKHNTGFIKDGKFIVTSQKRISDQTYHSIYKRYLGSLQNYLADGYTKDYNSYIGDDPIVPAYYINERTSQEEHMKASMGGVLRTQGLMQPAKPGDIPVGSPKPRTIKSGLFKHITLTKKPAIAVDLTSKQEEDEN